MHFYYASIFKNHNLYICNIEEKYFQTQSDIAQSDIARETASVAHK